MGIYDFLVNKGFERRKSQEIMMDLVRKVIDEGGIKLIEAPTGTGKTFGYLIPIMESKIKAIISTGTKVLQDQLRRDIEFLSAQFHVIYGEDINYAVVKGKANYLCIDRYESSGKISEIERLLEEGWDGDLSRVVLDNVDAEKINIDEDYCTSAYRRVCPYYDMCLYWMKLKDMERRADIIVINHALLGLKEFEDSKDRILVIDEAHELDKYLTLSSGLSVSLYFLYQIKGYLEDLGESVSFNPEYFFRRFFEGILSEEKEEAPLENFLPYVRDFEKDITKPVLDTWKRVRENLVTELEEFLKSRLMISFKFKTYLENVGIVDKEILSSVKAGYEEETEEEKVFIKKVKSYEFVLKKIMKLERFTEIMRDAPEDLGYKVSRSWSRKLGTFNYKMEIFPIFPRGIIHPEDYRGIVMTSATVDPYDIELTTGIVGEYHSLPYNFDYSKVTFIVKDANPKEEGWEECLKEAYLYLKTLHRKILVLLTNKRHLNLFEGKDVGRQGEAPLMVLMEDFLKDRVDVLVGLDSLWTGVDLKGEKGILMAKLPFDSPDDPVTFHRLRFLRNTGTDPFIYQRKRAFMKFRQGFGRLMRQATDFGTVIMCDRRIWRYREFIDFLRSLGVRIVYRSNRRVKNRY